MVKYKYGLFEVFGDLDILGGDIMKSSIIRFFKQRKVVEKIIDSKGDITVFTLEKKRVKMELALFKKKAENAIEETGYVVEDYKINPDYALQIAFICIMTGICEYDLFRDWRKLQLALFAVKGKYHDVARKLGLIMENSSITIFDEESLLKQII